MRYTITHTTTYSGPEPVSVGQNEAWLRPRELQHQAVMRHELDIEPMPSTHSWRHDYFGNAVSTFSFNRGYDELKVTAISQVLLAPRAISRTMPSPPWEDVREMLREHPTPSDLAACEFTFASPRVRLREDLATYGKVSFTPRRPIVEAIADLAERIHRDFQFDPRATVVTTSVEEVFRLRRGVCQDFAHLQIAILRSLGLAARYVSGYIRTLPPPGKPRLVGADASHAWVSVYCGPLGWIDIDPTNKQFPSVDHITVGWGRDYGDVAPLKGVYIGGGSHVLEVSVDVNPDDL